MLILLLIVSVPGIEPIPYIEVDTIRLHYKTLDSTALIIYWDWDIMDMGYSYTYQDFMDMNKLERDNIAFIISVLQTTSSWRLTKKDRKMWRQFLWDLLPKRVGVLDSLPDER